MKKISLLIAGLVASFGLSAATFNVTVPEGTNECYVAGTPSWGDNFVKMEGSGTSYSVTTDLLDGKEFKYLSGPDWSYAEVLDNNGNRTTMGNPDVVTAWQAVYDPGATPDIKNITVKVKADQAPTIWWWNGGSQCPDAEAAGETWPGPTMAADAANAGWFAKTFENVNGSIGVKIGGNAAFFDKTISADICIDATGANIDCPGNGGVTPPTPPTPGPGTTPGAGDGKYFVWGNGNADPTGAWLGGAAWDAGTTSMTGNTITYANVPAGTWEFKVTNGAWPGKTTPSGAPGQEWGFTYLNAASTEGVVDNGGNFQFTTSAPGDITISFLEGDELPIKIESTTPFGKITITSYTIVGSAALLGSATDFDINDNNNNMSLQSDGTWKLIKRNVQLEVTDPIASADEQLYKYKVVGNHNYSVFNYPALGDLFISVETEGTYDVLFVFNPNAEDEDVENKLNATLNEPGTLPEVSVEDVAAEANVTVSNGYIDADEAFEIYNLVGQNVSAQNGQLFGIYIVKFANSAIKVNVR